MSRFLDNRRLDIIDGVSASLYFRVDFPVDFLRLGRFGTIRYSSVPASPPPPPRFSFQMSFSLSKRHGSRHENGVLFSVDRACFRTFLTPNRPSHSFPRYFFRVLLRTLTPPSPAHTKSLSYAIRIMKERKVLPRHPSNCRLLFEFDSTMHIGTAWRLLTSHDAY